MTESPAGDDTDHRRSNMWFAGQPVAQGETETNAFHC
jgi:hypothetical protein